MLTPQRNVCGSGGTYTSWQREPWRRRSGSKPAFSVLRSGNLDEIPSLPTELPCRDGRCLRGHRLTPAADVAVTGAEEESVRRAAQAADVVALTWEQVPTWMPVTHSTPACSRHAAPSSLCLQVGDVESERDFLISPSVSATVSRRVMR